MLSLDDAFRSSGTRFLVYVQPPILDEFSRPETIWVSSPAGSLGPGPSDQRMYVLNPIEKQPYENNFPPYRGACHPPSLPDSDGHFDHLASDDPVFRDAHVFGCVRRVLDVWEAYLGGPIAWPFSATHSRLELIPYVPWDNAQFGWGFMELGEGEDDQNIKQPFALNFDVLAHETGHGILFSLVGMPNETQYTTSFRGFHESATDCIAMISALHFDSLIDHLLTETSGDLYTRNELNRIGELSNTRQIRDAANALKMADVIPIDTPVKDATGKQIHKLGLPLTGAIFDVIVDVFVDRLLERGLIESKDAGALRRGPFEGTPENSACVAAYKQNPAGFRDALCEARDMVGMRLAQTWHRLTPEDLSFATVANEFLQADFLLSGAKNQPGIAECFEWRGIL